MGLQGHLSEHEIIDWIVRGYTDAEIIALIAKNTDCHIADITITVAATREKLRRSSSIPDDAIRALVSHATIEVITKALENNKLEAALKAAQLMLKSRGLEEPNQKKMLIESLPAQEREKMLADLLQKAKHPALFGESTNHPE